MNHVILKLENKLDRLAFLDEEEMLDEQKRLKKQKGKGKEKKSCEIPSR